MVDTYVGAIDTVALLVKVGDGGSPETFTHPCLINTTRGITAVAAATANQVPDCTDPTKPMKTMRTVTSTDVSIDGQGTLDETSVKTYWDWLQSGAAKNIQVQIGSATGDLLVQGPFVLTSFAITGAKHGDLVACTLKLEQSDANTSSAHA